MCFPCTECTATKRQKWAKHMILHIKCCCTLSMNICPLDQYLFWSLLSAEGNTPCQCLGWSCIQYDFPTDNEHFHTANKNTINSAHSIWLLNFSTLVYWLWHCLLNRAERILCLRVRSVLKRANAVLRSGFCCDDTIPYAVHKWMWFFCIYYINKP